jgi:hypothetical protein
MAATKDRPVYTATLKHGNSKYKLAGVMTDLVLSHEENELAMKVTISLVNVKVGKTWLHNLINLRDTIYVYANTGSGATEVFRGYIWERRYVYTGDGRELNLICYDRLIYLQNSKDNFVLRKGDRTKEAIARICKAWGVKYDYNYTSISNSQKIYRNQDLSDIIVDILNKTKKKSGTKYAVKCVKGTMTINKVGTNKTVYKLEKKDNAIGTEYIETMDGMITKVKIVKAQKSKNKETGKYTTVATVKGDTAKYGTLQDIIEQGTNEKLADVRKEAQSTIKSKGKPTKTIRITAVDIPWVSKGDKVSIDAGNLNGNYIVYGLNHDANDHTMTLEVKKA